MCGISGIINFGNTPVSKEILDEMNYSQFHRGPDEGNSVVFNNIGLAHRRLSIIALDNGKQPMTNENSNIWITFNGEIYNYLSLKKQLIKSGHIFSTDSDTEVIIHLYEEYGNKCVDYLEGMFAFGIYDKANCKVFLARDRLGQKPLHYYTDSNKFIFSSEIQAITKHPNINKEINYQSIHDYLTLLYIPCPNTIYRNIFKLPPATYLEFDIKKKRRSLSKYWQPNYSNKTSISYNDAKYELRRLLELAVEKRLMSEVPLGAFLSGGVDSTIISGLISNNITKEPISTFTIGFEENKYDERKYAKTASEILKTKHHEKVVNPLDFSIIPKLVKHFGEPYADSSMLPTYLLCKFARENTTVAISGDGADELFAGYERYYAYWLTAKSDIFPNSLKSKIHQFLNSILPAGNNDKALIERIKRFSKALSSDLPNRYLNMISKCSEEIKQPLYGEQLKDFNPSSTKLHMQKLFNTVTSLDQAEKVMELDLHSYLPNDILTKIDITSMANSLEVRSPFMDHDVVNFAASLPLKYKLGMKTRKKILIDSCSDLIPKTLQKRSKMGFGVPVASWLRNEWKKMATELLLDGNSIKDGFFNSKTVSEMLHSHQKNKADHSYLIWSLIIFELWYKQNF